MKEASRKRDLKRWYFNALKILSVEKKSIHRIYEIEKSRQVLQMDKFHSSRCFATANCQI